MSEDDIKLPIIDLSGYIAPKSPEDKERVIAEVRDACKKYGFFQVKGHGVPLNSQQELLKSIKTLFSMPKEEKLKLSYLDNPSRRGYEASGMSMREGDAMPDSKEVRSSLARTVLGRLLSPRYQVLMVRQGLLYRSRRSGRGVFRLPRPQRLA